MPFQKGHTINLGIKRSEETKQRMRETHKKIGAPWIKGKKLSEEHKRKIGLARKGKKHTLEARRKMSEATKGKKRRPRSEETKRKMSESLKGKKFSEERRRKMSEAHKGEKSHSWRGGITSIHHKIRGSVEYRLAREACFKRDNYTCIWCGDNRGGNLNADHIKPFALFPELRFALDNLRTLCIDCHKKTDTYGSKYINALANKD